jgi:type VI secretion system secreted protein Hcp
MICTLSKSRVAIALVAFAFLSYAYAMTNDTSVESGILTAVAADQAQNYRMFLKLDTVPGESADGVHKGEIEIDSYAWSISRSMGAAKPTLGSITVTMPANKASGRLMLYTAGSLKISRAVLSVRKNNSNEDFLKWILTDVNPVSYQTVGNIHGDGVIDQVTFAAGKVEVEYRPTDGSALVKAGWDQRTGKSVSY